MNIQKQLGGGGSGRGLGWGDQGICERRSVKIQQKKIGGGVRGCRVGGGGGRVGGDRMNVNEE